MRSRASVSAERLDISTDGACIMTERAQEPARVARLRPRYPDTEIRAPGLSEVKWVVQADGKFKMEVQLLM